MNLKDKLSRLIKEFSFIRGNLLVLIISWVLFDIGFGMTWLYETPYIRGLGASPAIIGFISFIGLIILAIVSIPGSYIADKHGRRGIIISMTFGVALSYLFFILAPDWRYILIGYIIENICLIYRPALDAITADSIPPEKRGLGYAACRVIPEIPAIASPLIAGYFVSKYGLVPGMRIVYLITMILGLGAAMVRLLFLKETLIEAKPIKLNDLIMVYRDSVKSIIDVWRDTSPSIRLTALISILMAIGEPIYSNYSPLYVFDIVRVSKFEWSIIVTVLNIVVLITGLPSGKLVDLIGRRSSMILAYLIFIPSEIIFILSRSFNHLMASYILFGIASSLFMPSFQAYTADVTPREIRGRILGSIGIIRLLLEALVSLIGGMLYQLDPVYPFLLVIIIDISILLIIVSMIREPYIKFE